MSEDGMEFYNKFRDMCISKGVRYPFLWVDLTSQEKEVWNELEKISLIQVIDKSEGVKNALRGCIKEVNNIIGEVL